ncbi:MAG: AraC family transcriptional regulator [Pseudomonadota bacterium]
MTERGWIRRSEGSRECMEAFFYGNAYAPHRHDTYTFAVTTRGVQSFNYRGALRHSSPGGIIVLHPDELHDGQAGTDEGFGYQSICIAPGDLQHVLGGRPLPFIRGGVSDDRRLRAVLATLLGELDHPLEAAEYDDTLYDLAQLLAHLGDRTTPAAEVIPASDVSAVARARDYIDTHLIDGFELATLEQVTGQSRWQLSRDFRALLGTSPYRYLVMRRLDLARQRLLTGERLADIAHACGFADQSHFNRHFKKTYGQAPKRWASSVHSAP